jgi:hypothetical protein
MNQLIEKLAEQARNYALDEKRIYERVHNTEQCMEEYREVYNTKFAELIVRECIEQVWYTREDGINGNVSQIIKDRIKQHFEVGGMSTADKKTLIKQLLGVEK